MLPTQIILLGGGASLRYLGALDKGLFNFLQNKFVIGINYSYKFINTTCTLGIDEPLYNSPEHNKELSTLPLVIWKSYKHLSQGHPNTIFLHANKKYDRDLKGGIYRASLSGIFALSLAIKLLDLSQKQEILSPSGIKIQPEICLLGFDYGPQMKDGKVVLDSQGKAITHWYQEEFKHRGTGKINWFQQTWLDAKTMKRIPYSELEWRPFINEKEVKIFNVGGTSKIQMFPHISYEEFFKKEFNTVSNQDEVRKELRETLLKIKTENNI